MSNTSEKASYVARIDTIMTNIASETRIVYLESDYPNVLDMVLNGVTGSKPLRRWLGITRWSNFETARRAFAARPVLSVFKNYAGFGILEKDANAEKTQQTIEANLTEPVRLVLGNNGQTRAVHVEYPEKSLCFSFSISRSAEPAPGKAHKIQIDDLPEATYLVKKRANILFKADAQPLASVKYSDCCFFYLTNADSLGQDIISRIIQAFLESNLYPKAKLILTGTSRAIPETLSGFVQLIRLSSPSKKDILHQFTAKLEAEAEEDLPFDEKQLDRFASILTGLTYLQLESIYAAIPYGYFFRNPENGEQMLRELVMQQRQLENEKDPTLNYEVIDQNPGVVGIGGFMRWLNANLPDLIDPENAIQYGITPPKGVILTGVPGTGKSQLSKQMAYLWRTKDKNVGRFTFNIGNLSSSMYGASEAKMEHFLSRLSEQESGLLFIDEIEKTFYQDKSGQGMHEVKKQQMGMLLGWLQEHKNNIFTFMTSNDISILPPELVRTGRISERFFVFMPNSEELLCMLYFFLRKQAENNLFHQNFNEEILEICDVIAHHSCAFGSGDESDDTVLDEELTKALMSGSLHTVLEKLGKFASETKRTPFMTGADMHELVRNTVQHLRRGSLCECTGADFAETMISICCRDDFSPYGQSNLDKLAKMYLSCDYRDASAHPLFPRKKFDVQSGTFAMCGEYIDGTNPVGSYDRYMQQRLKQEIEAAALDQNWDKEYRQFQKEQVQWQRKQWAKEDRKA